MIESVDTVEWKAFLCVQFSHDWVCNVNRRTRTDDQEDCIGSLSRRSLSEQEVGRSTAREVRN